MKAAPFEYCRPATVREAVAALVAAGGDGKILAGGQSLVPVLAMRLGRPSVLIDINRIPGLAAIDKLNDNTVRVGALVRHSKLVDQQLMPLLGEAASWIGHAAIRNRGTSGGSIAHADSAAELPVVAAALDARIHAVGPEGSRVLTANEFFVGGMETSLSEFEIVSAIDMPMPTRWGFAELSRRQGDFGLVTVVAAEVEGHIRVALGGVGPVPIRPREAEEILAGGPLDVARVAGAARAAAASIDVAADIHSSVAYRRAMTEEFTRRALMCILPNTIEDAT